MKKISFGPRRFFTAVLWWLLIFPAQASGPAEPLANSKKVVGSSNIAAFFNVRLYGAMGDGKTLDTKALQAAIEAAAAAGGGTVYFPAGTYRSFSIRLQSNIALFFDAGSVLQAADPVTDGVAGYDEAEPNEWGDRHGYQDFGHSHWHNSLIWGENLQNISILGTGLINGTGLSRGLERQRKGMGNKTIALKQCRNVVLKDFTLLYGGHFGLLATGVDNLTIDNLKMDVIRDGMDIDCCQNVRISNCTINAPNDDAICLKSSFALGYARPTQNVTITNCSVSGYDLGTLYKGTYERREWHKVPDREGPTGRIKFGTESNGGFKNITISNCVFEYCRGLALETVDGALLEDIAISNITMRDVTNSPLFFRLGARLRGPAQTPVGRLRRVSVNNLIAYNADAHFATIIAGLPGHPVEQIALSNIQIYYRPIDSAQSAIQAVVPEHEKTYPEPAKMGVLPAYGFFIRHAAEVALTNVQIHYLGAETRPPFYLEDVTGIALRGVKAQPVGGAPLLVVKNVAGLLIKDCDGLADGFVNETWSRKLYAKPLREQGIK